MSELKPCPFCGGDAYKKASDVFCENPRCCIYERAMPDSQWNTRTPSLTLARDALENIAVGNVKHVTGETDAQWLKRVAQYAKATLAAIKQMEGV